MENQITDLSSSEKELEGYIAALKGKKGEMREELKLYKASRKENSSASGGVAVNKGASIADKVSKAESAFGRVMENTTGISQGSSAADRNTAAALKELEDMSRNNRIQERLAAIKGKRGKSE